MNVPLILLLTITMVLIPFSCLGVIADNSLYSTDFVDAEGWETNSNNSFYLDEQSGRYHYLIEGGTGSYAAFPLENPYTGSFTLEFDVYPIKTEEKSSFRFGLGTANLDSQKGPLVIAELNNQNEENAFSLVAISQENLRSKTFSIPGKENYSGKRVRFEDGEEYHIRLTWYPADSRVSMTVTKPGEETPLFSHFVKVSGKIEELTHLFMTSTGEGQNGMKAEGFIDNICLNALSTVSEQKTPSVTETEITPTPTLVTEPEIEPMETIAPIDTIPVRTPLPAPPTPTPTQKSGLCPIVGVFALFAAIFLIKRA